MAIFALALYGSRARGDNIENSDFDLFALTDDQEYRMIVSGNSNIACYPYPLAVDRAKEGDLFILHICAEAKELYSTGGEFQQLKSEFCYKEDYSREISLAADLAWFLVEFGTDFKNFTLLNKRIAWCVRTMLIAKSAEAKAPVFSASELSRISGTSITSTLIEGKSCISFDRKLTEGLLIFLRQNNAPRPIVVNKPKLEEYLTLFEKTNNIMGLKTLGSISSESAAGNYF